MEFDGFINLFAGAPEKWAIEDVELLLMQNGDENTNFKKLFVLHTIGMHLEF